MREIENVMVHRYPQVPGAITVAGHSDFSHVMPVEIAGWLMNQLPAAVGGGFQWVLLGTEDRHLRLPTALLMREPVTASCVCGLLTEKQDPTVKARLDTLITEEVIPRARTMDSLLALKWALQLLCFTTSYHEAIVLCDIPIPPPSFITVLPPYCEAFS